MNLSSMLVSYYGMADSQTSRLSEAFAVSTKKVYADLSGLYGLHQVNVFNLLYFLICLHFNGLRFNGQV